MGVVTSVTMGFGRMGQSYYFETTIPIRGGFSGAPVVSKPVVGQPITVCGVVSSDISADEAFTNFLIAGNSSASMLWPSMGLFLPCAMPGETTISPHLLAEFLKPGMMDNRTTGVTVIAQDDAEKIEIRYWDTRQTPPSDHLLTTKGIVSA